MDVELVPDVEEPVVKREVEGFLADEFDYQRPRRGDIRSGVVMDIGPKGAIVDIGLKREGLVPPDDLALLGEEARAEIQVGTKLPVLILKTEDHAGDLILSIYQARLHQDWLEAERLLETGELWEGEISGYNRGGLTVQFGKIRGFIPVSHIGGLPRGLKPDERRKRLQSMVGEQVGLKVIEVNRRHRRLIFSHRQAQRAHQELRRTRLLESLTEGEVRRGVVTDITSFGAFVDLGGADGLIHLSELAWHQVSDPREVLNIGDEVDVYVLRLDRERKRIGLSLKRLQPDPWTVAQERYRVGQLVEGRVAKLTDFGAFVELDVGVEGLLHISEMVGGPQVKPDEVITPGEPVLLRVIKLDTRRRRIGLSAKRVRAEEWEVWAAERAARRQ